MKYFLSVLTIFLLWSCSQQNQAPSKKATERTKTKPVKTDKINPTTLLTLEMVASHFKLDATTIVLKYKEGNKYCSYSWDKPNKEEIDKQNAERIMKRVQDKLKGLEVKSILLSTENEVFFNFYRTFDSKEKAAVSFGAMITNLEKGIVVKDKEGESHTFKVTYDQMVEGVGDQAAWSAEMNQVSVQNEAHLFHLTVNISEDREENLSRASSLAKKIIKNM